MRTPETLRSADREDAVVTEHEYDDESLIVVDFGTDGADLSIDTVDGTVIAIADGDQFEFALPNDASDVTANNGVLTITE